MPQYTKEELTQALKAVTSIISKCEKAQESMAQKACTAQQTLLKNRLSAMYISKAFITEALEQG